MSIRGWTDLRMEIIIGALLRTGVILAAFVVLSGALVYLAHHGGEVVDYSAFHGEPEALRSMSGIIQGALHGDGSALIQLGLLLLIATPVARVAFSAVGFAIERDSLYVGITLFVLAVLLYSLFGSH
jgi:uncharacterized membrane protein